MSPLVPLIASAAAAALLYARVRRRANRGKLPPIADPRPQALVESALAGFTVLIVGWILAAMMAPAPLYLAPLFTMLAVAICLSQFRSTMRRGNMPEPA